jgi:ABC-type transport system involved in multi-copper enzyme maturation permease subunit
LRELAAEIRKVRTRWLPYVILLFLVIGAVVQIALFGLVAYLDERGEYGYGDFPPGFRTFVFPWSLHTLLDSGQFWGSVFIAFLIASVVSTEYTWGTIRASVSRGQGRMRFLSWKLAGTALTCAVLLLVTLGIGLLLSLVLTATRGEPITLDVRGGPEAVEVPIMVLRAGLGILPYGMLAFCLAVVGRSTALAATGTLIYKLLESILLPSFEALGGVWADLRVLFIGYYADALIAANRLDRLEYNSLALRELPEASGLPDPWVASLMLLLFTGLFAGIAFYVFLRRDLTINSE